MVIGIAGALVEDAGSTWAAVYLSTSLDATPTVAGLGFVVEGPWWRLALLAVVPYGLAYWLAGRIGRRAGAPRRS